MQKQNASFKYADGEPVMPQKCTRNPLIPVSVILHNRSDEERPSPLNA